MGHRGLTGVGLPVGVGDEADRGVPGDVVGHRGQAQRQPQSVLQSQERVEPEQRDRGEGEHAAGVHTPGLFCPGVDPDQAVDDAVLLGGDDAVHVVAERPVRDR